MVFCLRTIPLPQYPYQMFFPHAVSALKHTRALGRSASVSMPRTKLCAECALHVATSHIKAGVAEFRPNYLIRRLATHVTYIFLFL
jgi:hypothetical protein